MAARAEFLRYASPVELRCIARENVGHYNAVIIGAVYDFSIAIDVKDPKSYFHPLARCIEQHPFFCVTVDDADSDKAFFQRVTGIDLVDHISIINDPTAESAPLQAMKSVLASDLDRPFPPGIPPWRILVLPLSPSQSFIAFAYSHAIGDGPTGITFHKTFLAACRRETFDIRTSSSSSSSSSSTVKPPTTALPTPFDTPERLPISWSFLLAPLVANLIPHFIAKLFGLGHGASRVDEGTWTARPAFFDPETHRSKIRIGEVDASSLAAIVQAARAHDAKLTGTLHQLITRALSAAIPDSKVTNFVGTTSMNMRRAIGMPADAVAGNIFSGAYTRHPRVGKGGDGEDSALTDEEWASAVATTRELARAAVTLRDQPIGLLRFLPGIRNWTLGQVGKRRDSSYEISNVGSFDGDAGDDVAERERVRISKVVFGQPGHVAGNPISFNFAAVKGGSLVYTVTWQRGGLLGEREAEAEGEGDEEEDEVVDKICDALERGFRDLASSS